MIIYLNNIISMNTLSIEQKIIKHLANIGFLSSVGDVTEALKSQQYAEWLITGDGIDDEVKEQYGENIEGDCNHESLTNEEIQEVFDNDTE